MAVVPGTNHTPPTGYAAPVYYIWPDPVYVWAGAARDAVPGRVEMTRCEVCRLLVETTEAAAHTAWHEGGA